MLGPSVTILNDFFPPQDNTGYFDSCWGSEDNWIQTGCRVQAGILLIKIESSGWNWWAGSEAGDGRIPFTVQSMAWQVAYKTSRT